MILLMINDYRWWNHLHCIFCEGFYHRRHAVEQWAAAPFEADVGGENTYLRM